MVQGDRCRRPSGPFSVGSCRRVLLQGLAAARAQRMERLRRPVSALRPVQVDEGLTGGRLRGERSLGPMLLLAAEGVLRQPEQLLVGDTSNLLDLRLPQKARSQPAG